jgi:c-di-GMP-binding flagellar brake protein YcgR
MSTENEIAPDGALAGSFFLNTAGVERRRYLRVRPDVLSAILIVNGERYVVAIRDISTGGARIANAPLGLEVDDRIEIVARLEDEMVEVGCPVARVEENLICPTIGVEFLAVDKADTEKLLSFVSSIGMELVKR